MQLGNEQKKHPTLPSSLFSTGLTYGEGSRSAKLRKPLHDLGKLIFFLGLGLTLVGALLWKTGGLGGLGRLPGDIFIQRGNSTFTFPIVTCLLVSAALSLLMWLLRR